MRVVISASGSPADGAGVAAEAVDEGDDESIADGVATGAEDVSLAGAVGGVVASGVPAAADGVLAFAGVGADVEFGAALLVVAPPVAVDVALIAAGAAPLVGDAARGAAAPEVAGAEGVAAGG